MTPRHQIERLLQDEPRVEFAVLVGSQANGTATDRSDWDIALQWTRDLNPFETLEHAELLKQRMSQATGVHPDKIDLIDLATARLAMRAVVAEEGIVLKGADTLAWHHFLTATWAALEDFYWRKRHAA